jgi:hypothetical protein
MALDFVIISKRLEQDRFSRFNPMYPNEVILTEAEFGLYFEGANLEKRFIESPNEIKKSRSEKIRLHNIAP